MKRYTLFRLPFEVAALALSIAPLAITPQTALAQHGGGHGGGGHAGGGGGHVGGFGGGGGNAAGYAGSHPAPSQHATSPHTVTTPPAHSVNAARTPTPDSLPPGMVGALNRGNPPSAGLHIAQSALPAGQSAKGITEFNAAPPHTTIGFPPIAGSATTFPTAPRQSGPLSFSGQGHEIWQNSAPSTLSSADRNRPLLQMRPQPPHIIRGLPPYLYQGTYFPAFGYYGFSPFFGFGWGPGCDPFDPWGFGCSGFGYGYGYGPGYGYGYGAGYGGSYPYAPDYSVAPDDSSNVSPGEYGPFSWQNPPSDSNEQSNAAAPNSVIYLQDGTNYEVSDYWVSEGKLHYVTNYGGENSVDLGQVDIQRSVDANASRGLSFSLHPAQAAPLTPPPAADGGAASPPAPQSPAAPNAPPSPAPRSPQP